MHTAEDKGGSMGKRALTLGVVKQNRGASRRYERSGYATIGRNRGVFVGLATRWEQVRRMQKPLVVG